MPALTRGPLPASVYWRRRVVLLIVPLVLVVGLAKILGHHSGAGVDAQLAANHTATHRHHQVSPPTGPSVTDSSTMSTDPSGSPSESTSESPSVSTSPTVLPSPEGSCAASDVVVTPTVAQATAGGEVDLALALHTNSSIACTWALSHRALQLAITEGGAPVWSTVDCPSAVPTESVVVRRDSTTTVEVPWSGRYSAAGCAGHTDWAKPGKYVAEAAAMGGEPAELDFSLVHETTQTQPSGSATASGSANPSSSPSATGSPTGKPTHGTSTHRKSTHRKPAAGNS